MFMFWYGVLIALQIVVALLVALLVVCLVAYAVTGIRDNGFKVFKK